jgi:hypothetical protein
MAVPPVTSTISPTISVAFPSGISGVGITYNQFLNSLGKYNYGVEFFYLSSTSFTQVGQPVYYNHFDANGNSITTFIPFAVDPYQSQPSIFYEVNSDEIIITNLSSMQLVVEAGTTLYFKFFSTITYLGNELDDKKDDTGFDLFTEIEKRESMNFFSGYCDYLIDEDLNYGN